MTDRFLGTDGGCDSRLLRGPDPQGHRRGRRGAGGLPGALARSPWPRSPGIRCSGWSASPTSRTTAPSRSRRKARRRTASARQGRRPSSRPWRIRSGRARSSGSRRRRRRPTASSPRAGRRRSPSRGARRARRISAPSGTSSCSRPRAPRASTPAKASSTRCRSGSRRPWRSSRSRATWPAAPPGRW